VRRTHPANLIGKVKRLSRELSVFESPLSKIKDGRVTKELMAVYAAWPVLKDAVI
jgi:hypothetical protein